MLIQINPTELCTTLAYRRTNDIMEAGGFTFDETKINKGTHTIWTPMAQKIFDRHYNYYWDNASYSRRIKTKKTLPKNSEPKPY